MKTVLSISIVVVLAGACGAPAQAQPAEPASPGETLDKAAAVDKDREVYDRLVREIRRDRALLSQAYALGVDEARKGGGQPPAARRAEIIALRERIDRNGVRLMLVAGRHGWPVPELSAETVVKGTAPDEVDARARLVPPDRVIADVLSADARKLAASLRLPVITLVKAPSKKRS